uniref:ATP synthase subunit delta, chloroplastic n=1 Tax=Thuretia quercifolia TaxID=189650 RepID=A0A1Z1MKK0_9FLOR|nr:ATP synthase CF1 subunit delta [Thuretia quercifolia]ARW66409.1 ATP synthase CF1 subunit delta [Thuretia quercifolia]
MNNQNIIEKVSVPYAEALLELAQTSNLLLEAGQDLLFISDTLSNSKDLQTFLANPLINVLAKKNLLNELFKSRINNFILNFLLVLVDRRRISLLIIIINKYLELSYRLESTTIAELSTTVALNEDQQNSLIQKIKVITNSKNVKLVTNIDSNLIGGFIIKIGSKVIDASLAGKLKKMSFYLNTN